MKTRKNDYQLKFDIKINKPWHSARIQRFVNNLRKNLEIKPYWRSGFSWLGLFSSIIFGINSLLIVYLNFGKLPDKIAIMFSEGNESNILKDKYLLYFFPFFLIITGIALSFSLEKIFSRLPRFVKFIDILMFLLSLTQLLSIYKITKIYI